MSNYNSIYTGSQIDTGITNSTNLNNADIIKRTLELGTRISETIFNKDSDMNIDGRPIISDPNSKVYLFACGDNGGNPTIIDSFGTKGGNLDIGNGEALFSEYFDIGYYPQYINRPTTELPSYAKFQMCSGKYPSGILQFHFTDNTSKTSYCKVFTYNNVVYMIFDLSDINDLKLGLTLKSSEGTKNFTGSYKTESDQGYFTVKDNTSGLWFGATCTTMNEHEIQATPIAVVYGLNEDNSSIADSACSLALGKDGIGSTGKVVFCLSANDTEAEVKASILDGLTNYNTNLLLAIADWEDYFEGLHEKYNYLSPKMAYKFYQCLQQIRMTNYQGFLSSGLPNWYANFIRDTAWTVYGLSNVDHEPTQQLAASFLDWFADVDSFDHANSFTFNQTRRETTMNQTDSAPTFLLAVGEAYNKFSYSATPILPILEKCMEYCEANYNATDGHITCLHAHDYWDDYVAEIDVSLVKYESMIDVLWIAGLESIAPVFTSLGLTEKASYCTTVATNLRANLEDFRGDDGYLHYAIKTDNTLYSTVSALPGVLYAAFLLEDEGAVSWIQNFSQQLRVAYGFLDIPLTHSNSNSAVLKEDIWMPYLPMVGYVLRNIDRTLLDQLSSQFKFGTFPEYGQFANADHIIYRSHAPTFTWAMGIYVLICAKLAV